MIDLPAFAGCDQLKRGLKEKRDLHIDREEIR